MTISRNEGWYDPCEPQLEQPESPRLRVVETEDDSESYNDPVAEMRNFITSRAVVPSSHDAQSYRKHGTYTYPDTLPGYDVYFARRYYGPVAGYPGPGYYHEVTIAPAHNPGLNEATPSDMLHIRINFDGNVFCDKNRETPCEGKQLTKLITLLQDLESAQDEEPGDDIKEYQEYCDSQTFRARAKNVARHALSRLIAPLRRSPDSGQTP